MPRDASELARRLARDAEAVCRHYLSKGRRQGRYWMVGDVRNTPGRSMYVRLSGPESGPGAAGRWSDAASAEHGDLLDVIRESCGLVEFREVAEEARRFLSLPRAEPPVAARAPAPRGSAEAARRLWAIAKPIAGTLAEAYLRNRGIIHLTSCGALRFHPRCWYRPDEHAPTETWPAMIAAVTHLSGAITGVHRTWIAPDGLGKAPIDTPRRAMGDLLGHAVRFGAGDNVLAAGEGIRDDAVAAMRAAGHAHGGRALGEPPCRSPVPTGASPSLHGPRRRCRRRYGSRGAHRTSRSGRHRSVSPRSAPRRPQRGSASVRLGRHPRIRAQPTRPRGRGSLHAPADSWDGMTEAGAPSPLTTPSGRP